MSSTTSLDVDPAWWAAHSEYSDPREHAAVLAAVGTRPEDLHAAATGLIGHYRASAHTLDPARLPTIDLRWLDRILAAGLAASSAPLAGRPHADRVAGCCRDHTLLVVGALRAHGVPARSRVGFARYLDPALALDHVVVERWDGARWVRSDPELDAAFGAAPLAGEPFDPFDMPTGPHSPFPTAAELWVAHRAHGLDLDAYGVRGVPALRGRGLVRAYLTLELAHRRRDELLLWDVWGPAPGDVPEAELDALADEIADLLVRADAGDVDAEREAARRYATDPRLHPGDRVRTTSPLGRSGWTDLRTRTTDWD
ncbi:MAG: transglutaminase domain-containing protein [Cellulomonas iranensis]|uniref:transglutaminase-like domain-containing protein n=1 Tax=Cellulomonas iranensis TaxID=76862 RepID=UPI001B039E24|nr:transglutaminase-like domain-containing protein [Cellulomonas iranensis]MBO9567812.1 transglutaminase domain-containing protein [Cellulomonas iranensis]UCN13933.1 transglutaminase-like domain-containing protein [Cellulomonas iranensis]